MKIDNIQYKIIISKQGIPTLAVIDENGQEIYIHSKYDPLKEAKILNQRFIPEKYDAVIILGAGLGYHLLPLIKLIDKYIKIIIIDIIKNIETEIAKNNDTNPLIKHDNIVFFTGMNPEILEAKFNQEIDFDEIKGIDVIDHPPSMRAFGNYYEEIKKIIKRVINKKAGNKATHKAFGMLYLRNIFKNLKLFPHLFPISIFYNTMSEYPSLVITSGPSIEEYIKKIKQHQDKFYIITVDSALNTLLGNSIVPDFFVSTDPQPFIYEHILESNAGRAIPIFTVTSHSLMILGFKNTSAVLSLNTHPFSQVFEDMFPSSIGDIDSKTGTVAGDAIMTSRRFGFNATGIIGFDFSFPGFKVYPAGTAYQKRFAYKSNRLNPLESINFDYIMKSCKGEKYKGKFTRKSFIQYKESLEKFLMQSNMNIYNINNKGIPIEGIRNINLDLFIKNFCGPEIDKSLVIKRKFKEYRPIQEIIAFNKLIEIMQNENIFQELVNASITQSLDQKKVERIKKLFNIMIGA